MSRDRQSVGDIFRDALSRKRNEVDRAEIRAFILKAGRDNGYTPTEQDDPPGYKITFSTRETISFDGKDFHLGRL